MDRILELKCHPTAQHLVSTVSDDQSTFVLRLWDVKAGEAIGRVELGSKGVFTTAWSADGRRIAVALKDKTLRIFDPRKPNETVTGPGHDSVRPARLIWSVHAVVERPDAHRLDSNHVLTTGFTRSASREVIVHRIGADGKLSVAARKMLDVSPAPLTPVWDGDTSILWLYARGDRTCSAFEIVLDGAVALKPLPSFEHGTLQSSWAFLPKTIVDVKEVEIARAFRLTPSTIDTVSFRIPRARAEFFQVRLRGRSQLISQDDVFPPTRLITESATDARAWWGGNDAEQTFVSLAPDGTTPRTSARRSDAADASSIASACPTHGPEHARSDRQGRDDRGPAPSSVRPRCLMTH